MNGTAPVRHNDALASWIPVLLGAIGEDEITLGLAAFVSVVVEAAGLVGTPHRRTAALVLEAALAALARVRAVGLLPRVYHRHVGVVTSGDKADAVIVPDQVRLGNNFVSYLAS